MSAVESLRGALRVRGTELWLDAHRKSPLSFVSHAHSDHIARHERVIATAATLRLMEHRLGKISGALAVPYHRPFELGPLSIELLPAGHVLGSAQARVIRADGLRIVYTGDLCTVESATAEPAEVAECDFLVMESTFGHPRYRFPPKHEVFDAVRGWCEEILARGEQPVLLAYALGKAQEAQKQLSERGLRLCAHRSIDEISKLYEASGAEVGAARLFEGTFRPGEVGLFPPHAWRRRKFRSLSRPRVAVLTGWAVDPGVASRYGAEVAFPVSDHADFPSLVAYAEATGAQEVLTVHGFAEELAAALRERGIEARAVGKPHQMELFGQPCLARTGS